MYLAILLRPCLLLKPESKEGSAIVDGAIAAFDELIVEVNRRDVEDRGAHLKKVRKSLEEKAQKLIDKVNKLDA